MTDDAGQTPGGEGDETAVDRTAPIDRTTTPPRTRSVSCTILAFNEEATLEAATLEVVTELRARRHHPLEVIIVDDGSTDGTPAIARQMAERYPEVRVVTHPRNRGPGSALITGFAESRHELICFHAADQQLPFAEVAALLPLLEDHDLVVGHRTARPGYTPLRLLSSRVYIALVHALFGLRQFEDFNFLYLYRKAVLDRLQIETRGVFMPTEILVKAVAAGARVTTARVTCLPRRAGVATCGRPAVIAETFLQLTGFWVRWRGRQLLGRLLGVAA